VRGLLEDYAKLHGTDVDAKTPLRTGDLGRIVEVLNQPHPTSARDLAAACWLLTPASSSAPPASPASTALTCSCPGGSPTR